MSWSVQAVILGCEMVLGYVLGRVFIPYFRRIKTGKFDFYIGDRFAKDGSEPKFGGVVIMLCVIFGIVTGVIFYDSQAVLSFENGEFSRRVFIALGGVLMLTAIGLSEDYVKEKKLGIGMKPFYKICMEYLICLRRSADGCAHAFSLGLCAVRRAFLSAFSAVYDSGDKHGEDTRLRRR